MNLLAAHSGFSIFSQLEMLSSPTTIPNPGSQVAQALGEEAVTQPTALILSHFPLTRR